ncbi:MAG: DUF4430 domain-containing protein [Candidatus Pacebacteria bacterium]|nr:DUF4430 domain-containing protein [Candidatus Paceibacterota bacterium]
MNNLIHGNNQPKSGLPRTKKLLIIFFIFSCLAAVSYIYINQSAPIENKNYSPRQISDNQYQLETEQAQQENVVSNIVPEENIKTSEATSTMSETVAGVKTEATGEPHILYVGEKKYEISVPEKSTVYELMDLLSAKNEISFAGKNSLGLGFFVEEINGIKNNPGENTYWIYYINDKAAQVGISNYILKPNDAINWKYEKPQF